MRPGAEARVSLMPIDGFPAPHERMGLGEWGTGEMRTHFHLRLFCCESRREKSFWTSLSVSCLCLLRYPTVNRVGALNEIQFILLLGLTMIVFSGQKIIQHLKNTIKKFSSSVSLWVLAASKEVFPLRSPFDIWPLILLSKFYFTNGNLRGSFVVHSITGVF